MENWTQTQIDFYNNMRSKLSKDPKSRLTAATKNLIEKDNCLFDVHCHIFDRKTVNIKYVLLRMALMRLFKLESEKAELSYWTEDVFDIYENANKSDTEADLKEFEDELNNLEIYIEQKETNEESFRGRGLKDAIRVVRKGNMEEIYDFYINNFSLTKVNEFKNNPFVACVLMMDLQTGWEVNTKKDFSEQVEELNILANNKPILPFFAIDPRRANLPGDKNLYTLFEKAFTNEDSRFFGVKCYPSLGYFPDDKRLEPIFKLCEEFNIPVTTHCGGESVSTHKKSIDYNGNQRRLEGNNRIERARLLNAPLHWKPVLEKFPNLKLNLAHFGTDHFWKNHINTNNNDERILDLIGMLNDDTKKVYTDFSYNLIEIEILYKLREVLDSNPQIKSKLMYGTDFWVVLPGSDLLNDINHYIATFRNDFQNMANYNIKNFLFN
jgi:predicted TIM-barrel fold metal-dependent hydrolase